jgi:hypothetical protein
LSTITDFEGIGDFFSTKVGGLAMTRPFGIAIGTLAGSGVSILGNSVGDTIAE